RELELEAGGDAEVAATATQAPEQIGILGGARVQDLAVGGDQLDREQVVDGEAELAHQVSHAAAEREPRDAGMRYVPAGDREAMLLRRDVDFRPDRSTPDHRAAG